MRKILPFLLLFCAQLNAEPDKTARHLMNDSPSMLEWGMFKIENEFSTLRFDGFESVSSQLFRVRYDWDQNELKLSMSVYPAYSEVKEQGAKNICREALTVVKRNLGYDFISSEDNYLSISKYFEHKAFTKASQTDTFHKDIEKMTRITITVRSNKEDVSPFFSQAECTSKFLEKAIYFEDKQ